MFPHQSIRIYLFQPFFQFQLQFCNSNFRKTFSCFNDVVSMFFKVFFIFVNHDDVNLSQLSIDVILTSKRDFDLMN